ncbi:ABC transporter ATP-binding protein [Arachnia propionica]|uniref:ATP-binding cassette domain-containing protein n=1 Tax=Arachnia propionica TaxID=1750 RepID=A0A3P1WRU1_9ACTN|nr:ATP-binding cassette domain-containing protein [Arachnia propionica]RRD48961.1 ATP-binding cassette domain-containing protein [Arachnia propionica]
MDGQAIAARTLELTKSYPVGPGRVIAVKDVTMQIRKGQLTALFGPSGSGKTPLVNCMVGLEAATSGSAWVGQHKVTDMKEQELTKLRRHSVGVAFRFPTLVPTLSVRENLNLPMSIAGSTPDEGWFKALVDAAQLGNHLDSPAGELPASYQQRVSVARALLPRPDLVVCDEPTGNLANEPSQALLDFIRRCVNDFQVTILLATHDPAIAARADRVLVLFDGQLVNDIKRPSSMGLAQRLSELRGTR